MPGLIYREEVNTSIPRVVHALRFSPGALTLSMRPTLAKDVIFPADKSNAISPVSTIAKRTEAIAAVNGDFFPYTGDPLGLMVRDGELISLPIFDRAAVAWGADDYSFGVAHWDGSMQADGGEAITIDGLNESIQPDKITLLTPIAGRVVAKAPNTVLILKVSGKLPVEGTFSGEVESITTDEDSITLKADHVAVVASGAKAGLLKGISTGTDLKVKIKVEGFNWSNQAQAIGGGPVLLRDGGSVIDWEAEKFKDVFALNRHPRTAIGKTKSGDIWLVSVEGRQPQSEGATLAELSDIMKRLGCLEAINLDGGGSSTLNVLGLTINRPSDLQTERPVANALILTGDKPKSDSATYTIQTPLEVPVGGTTLAEVATAKGNRLPGSEVLWTARGNAWIDQGGFVHGLKAGPATLYALVRGKVLNLRVNVMPAKKKA